MKWVGKGALEEYLLIKNSSFFAHKNNNSYLINPGIEVIKR